MDYYEEIKNKLVNNEHTKIVKDYSKNKSDLDTYYFVGKMLSEAGKHYGEGIIKEYSRKLTLEFGKGYSSRNLWIMLNFQSQHKKFPALCGGRNQLLSKHCRNAILLYILNW